VSTQQEVAVYWSQCRAKLGLTADVRWRTRRLGSTPEVCALLVDLIRTGHKTGTFSLSAEFEATGQPPPRAGEYLLITDFEGLPGCCVRLDVVQLLAFDQIGTEWVQVEGPALRDLGAWRKVHEEYWTRLLAGWGREFDGRASVICQRFGPPCVP
jgi:uncharacterized protein YhfF